MAVLFGGLSVLFFALYLYERMKNKSLGNEILYVKERVGTIAYAAENGYILIPSENTMIKELAAELNRLLDAFYFQKTDYVRSKQAMAQMLTNISHDLRTPLTVLKGYSELLIKEIKTVGISDHICKMAEKMDGKTDELVSAINAYFTMAKIESGDMRVEIKRVNITEICHEVLLDYYDVLEREQYEVDIRISSSPVYANADGEALKRILKNLVDNAMKHGGSGKYLGMQLEEIHGRIMIKVEDHGRGISIKEQEHIFSRNYTTAHNSSGNGLGLTIAQNLAMQMGADLLVSSEPDIKTVFTLSLKVCC